MYAFLRFATLTSLILFAAAIAAGAVAVIVVLSERPPATIAENPVSESCKAPIRLLLDRNCRARGDQPSAAQLQAANPVADEHPEAADNAAARPATESPTTAELTAAPAPPREVATASPEAPVERAAAAEPPVAPSRGEGPAVTPQSSAPPAESVAPPPTTLPAPSPATERGVAKPAAAVRPPAAKKTARRDRPAKPPASEALNAVRKFGGAQPEIPVSAYSADGTQRTIVIRPTSIQDYYYYSAPR